MFTDFFFFTTIKQLISHRKLCLFDWDDLLFHWSGIIYLWCFLKTDVCMEWSSMTYFLNCFSIMEINALYVVVAAAAAVRSLQSGQTLCKPMDCSLPASSVHGILQARMLEMVAILFSRGSSWLRDPTQISHMANRFFTIWATREAQWSRSICFVGMSLLILCSNRCW